MAMSNQGFPSYSFVMFLAFAAFGSYIWSSDPLQTARPQTQNSPVISQSSLNAVPARLWQDPFRIIYARDKNDSPRLIKNLKDTRLIPEIKHYLADDKTQELLVLGVMVSTEAIADAEERRRRRRYALINALSEAGYVPEDAKHIQVGMMTGWGKNRDRLILPYEWFKQDASVSFSESTSTEKDVHDASGKSATHSHKKVLLLWLDAAHYHKTPYLHLRRLVQTLAKAETRKKMRYAILGPADSGGLYSLVKRAYQDRTLSGEASPASTAVTELCQLQTAGIHILSPLATIADSYLYQKMKQPVKMLEQHLSALRNPAGQSCISFHRTVHSDDQLMFRMVLELWRRGIEPSNNHVVLLSELDTAFGRALPESFKQAFCGKRNQICQQKYIHTFSYLRGIDGVAPGSNTDLGLATLKASAARKKQQSNPGVSIRRPVGAGQFDYLRRIADEIVELDKRLRKQDGKGVLAIGVLGSDVYDKLLILRALRSRLMGVTFFSTDLDAQFLHPAEFPWTRNLVIASSFDLKLIPALQGSTPPFRDNYQTSIFYSSRLALQLTDEDFSRKVNLPTQLDPLLFEVGRKGLISLQPLDNENNHYAKDLFSTRHFELLPQDDAITQSELHPQAGKGELLSPLVITIAIIGLGLLALNQLNARANYQLRWLAIGMLVLAGVSALGIWCSIHEEPFILLAGVSVWPTEIINSLTLVLSLYFICTSLRSLDMNYRKISDDYLLLSWAQSMSKKWKSNAEASFCGNTETTKSNGWKAILALMLVVSALLVALLPRSIGYDNIPLMLLVWVLVLMVWFVLIYRVTPVASLNKWAAQIKQQDEMPIQQYWKIYGEYGAIKNRFLRAFTLVLIFQAFASFIFTLFGLEPAPLRGEVTRVIDSVITVSSLLGMLFLLFYMVDATRLCIIWIRGLTKNNYDWRGTAVDNLVVSMNIPWPCAVHWLKLKIVAQRTSEVSKLIYYPFLVIILILFSRINYFDDWGFPQSLAIITSCLIAVALYAATKLRQQAERVRKDFIDYLESEKITVSGNKAMPNKPSLAQLNELIENVSRLKKGAFQPFLEQPLVKASLLLLGGVGFSASQFSSLL